LAAARSGDSDVLPWTDINVTYYMTDSYVSISDKRRLAALSADRIATFTGTTGNYESGEE
jgi:hypothetical protein